MMELSATLYDFQDNSRWRNLYLPKISIRASSIRIGRQMDEGERRRERGGSLCCQTQWSYQTILHCRERFSCPGPPKQTLSVMKLPLDDSLFTGLPYGNVSLVTDSGFKWTEWMNWSTNCILNQLFHATDSKFIDSFENRIIMEWQYMTFRLVWFKVKVILSGCCQY